MRTINAAVIGVGFIGPAHLEALRRIGGVRILALASSRRALAEELAANYEIDKVYDKWQDVINDPDIEVVHNCTPNNLHYEINKAALLARKHVVSEKPLTTTSVESLELLKLARKSGMVNAVNFNYRFYPLIQHIHQMVRRGEIGDVSLVHGHYLQDWLFHDTDYNWRLEPSISGPSRAVADIGSHWCDLIQFVTGRSITSVCATLKRVHDHRMKPVAQVETFGNKHVEGGPRARSVRITTEDAAIVMFRLDNGAAGVVTVSQVSAGRKNREWFEIDGSTAAVAWDQENPNELWVGHRDAPNETIIKDPSLLDREARRYAHYPGGHPEGYPDGPKNLFINVYDFIRRGKDPRRTPTDFPTFEDGHRENRIVEAVLSSSRSQKWVNVRK